MKKTLAILMLTLLTILAALGTATASDEMALGDVKDIYHVYTEYNGYVVLETRYYGDMYYVNGEGTVVASGKGAEIVPGANSYMTEIQNGIELHDMQGNTLATFHEAWYEPGYEAIGAASEGLIMMQWAESSDENAACTMLYLDEKGNEVMRFDGMVHAGRASRFSGGVRLSAQKSWMRQAISNGISLITREIASR